MDSFQRRILNTWRRHSGDAGIRRVLVGVSGGLDSVVLLRTLAALAPELGLELAAAHFNHGLRGADSDEDQAWTRRLATSLGCVLQEETANLNAGDTDTRESMEMKARRLRHAFLARAAAGWGADAIALAHHADDQAEGFLIRLLRGSGGTGLGGMRWQSPSPADPLIPLVRPLLGESKQALLAEATAAGWTFREDASNQDPRILRNRIRHHLLPLLESEYQAGIRSVLVRSGELLSDEAAFVEESARRWLSAARRTRFERLHPAVQRAVMRIELWKLGQEPNFDLVETLRSRTTSVSVSPEQWVRRDPAGAVRLDLSKTPGMEGASNPSIAVCLRGVSGRVVLPEATLEWRVFATPKACARRRAGEEWFDLKAIGTALRVRHWQSGDRFQPLGMSQAARLQNLFVNRKVPADRRRRLWLVESLRLSEPRIAWVEGFPSGERFKVPARRPGTPGPRRILAMRLVR